MGGGGALTPTSTPSSPSCSSEPLPPEFGDYVAVSPVSDDGDDGSDECCVCDVAEVEALLYGDCRLQDRSLREAKEFIRRYKPGDLIEGVGDAKAGDYVLPEVTTLLLVGPRGAGKSTLVNRITRVFDKDDDPFAPDRAQVSRNSKSNGTTFLWEYPVPRNSNAICVYDTRSLSSNPEKNFKMLHRWMTKGVSHGEMATWDTDYDTKIEDMKSLGRQYSFLRCKTRKVNFVIFVIDGASVLESIDSDKKGYTEILHETFVYPFLSIGDDKPAVVVTHGDRLSIQQRVHVQNELAELLGVPLQQFFFIPGSDGYQTDLAILDMLRYCIHHAEQNLPIKLNYLLEVHGRETLKNIAERLMGLDAVIEATIIFLCIVILLLRFLDKLLQS
ncbi:uncharacterized protein LOC133885675 [Phragmites australis]|uniref:uncharacterized protein LOC133885675 n=1 Tax=Phragmites australis TaxID=29695 RepID=UPI002D7932EC|nr:uncharacterized protein LOC133885675 [Phragmites australis]